MALIEFQSNQYRGFLFFFIHLNRELKIRFLTYRIDLGIKKDTLKLKN